MSQVSELTALKIENVVLKLQNLQQTATKLYTDQQDLIKQAALEAGATEGQVYNTETRTFQDPTAKPVEPAKVVEGELIEV